MAPQRLRSFSAWEAGEPTSQEVFQAHTWPFEGPFGGFPGGVGARGGPEQLIKMATGNFADAYGMRPAQPMATPVLQATPWTIATERPVPTPRLGSCEVRRCRVGSEPVPRCGDPSHAPKRPSASTCHRVGPAIWPLVGTRAPSPLLVLSLGLDQHGRRVSHPPPPSPPPTDLRLRRHRGQCKSQSRLRSVSSTAYSTSSAMVFARREGLPRTATMADDS
jgi:hypothetical protein